jgi:hypothetical protein
LHKPDLAARICASVRDHRSFGVSDGDGFAVLSHPTR